MKQHNRWLIIYSLTILTLLFSACGGRPAGAAIASEPTVTRPPQSADAPLNITLTAPATLANGESLMLTFTLANTTDKDLYVLTWHTPFEGIANKIFRVTRNGVVLPYEGILAMRGNPSPDDYVLIQAKSSKSVDVDLASAYDVSKAGTYTIGYTSPILHIANSKEAMAKTQDDLQRTVIPSNTITVTIASDIAKPLEAAPSSEATSPQTPDIVPSQWETYVNEDFGYQLRVPPNAEIITSGVTRVPNDAVPEGTSPEAYIAQLQAQYPGGICVQIQGALVYINILAPTDLGPEYVPCGRTGTGAGELVEKSEQVNIGGNIYTAEGFEFVSSALNAGESLADHNETFTVELEDGTRIEYGARPQTDATYEDYTMQGRKVLLQILASYKSAPVNK